MRYPLAEQQLLTNFYESVQVYNSALAYIMGDDIRTVALYGLGGDRARAYPAVVRLRKQAQCLPLYYPKMLDRALEELGYSLLDVMRG